VKDLLFEERVSQTWQGVRGRTRRPSGVIEREVLLKEERLIPH
jgi:hypothetical protein